MHIIIVNDYDYAQGGASKVAIQTANLLNENGFEITFFCGVSNKEKSTLNRNIRVISTSSADCLNNFKLSGFFQGINNIESMKKMKKLINSINDNIIIHIHGWTKALSSSFIKSIKNNSKVKIILTLHDFFTICPNGGFFNYKKNEICHKKPMSFSCAFCNCDSRNYYFKIYRLIRIFYQNKINKFLKKIDAFITISNFQKQILSKYLNNKPQFLVYNPTSIEKNSINRIFAEKNQKYLFVGRVSKEKGIEQLCYYFSMTNEHLDIVGTGELEQKLKEKYKNNVNIVFHGWKSEKEVYHYMKNARALFFPSLWYEGAPLTIFEALSIGLPAIVSNVCAGSEFVSNETGRLFNPYSISEFNDILNELKNDNIIKKLSYNSYYKYWDNPFDGRRYFNEITNIYHNLT